MSQTALTNALIRHQIFIQRYAGGTNNKAQDELDRILALLLSAIGSGELNGFQQAYVSSLFDGVAEIAYGGSTDLLEPEAQWNSNVLMATNGIAVTASTSDELISIFNNRAATLIQGQAEVRMTPPDLTRQYTTSQTSQVLKIVRDGLLKGKTNRDIQNEIEQNFKLRTRNQTEAYVRTMVNQAANTAKEDTYRNAGIELEQYVAVLDRRTTVICASLDGNIYPVGQGEYPPKHFNCRSMRVPLVGDSTSAQVSEYGNWLKRQPKSTQVEVLGEERAELFRSGELTIDQFTDDRGIVYTLDELESLYDIEIEE